jgi:hypothetical protein
MVPAWLLKALPWVLAVALIGFTGWHLRAKQAAFEAQQAELKQLRIDLSEQKQFTAAASSVMSARVESAARIQTITKEVIREVPSRVPAGTPDLPGGWRVLHDAAASGEIPAAPGGADEAPVPAAAAAETVVDNYGACRDTADRLDKLQQWVREVSR